MNKESFIKSATYLAKEHKCELKEYSDKILLIFPTETKHASIYQEVITYLNETIKKNFKHSAKATRKLINGRVADGFELADFKHVIDVKAKEWLGTDFEKYLQPSTLFSQSKFESYLQQQAEVSDPLEAFFQRMKNDNQ